MSDLLELAKRVEDGEYVSATTINAALGMNLNKMRTNTAIRYGSLDAAKATHDEVLPGWEWGVDWLDDDKVAYVRKGMVLHESYSKEPAAAWVAAILRAKDSENE